MIDSGQVEGDLANKPKMVCWKCCDILWDKARLLHSDSGRQKPRSPAWEDVWVNIWAAFGCCCYTGELSCRPEEMALVSQALQ